MEYNYMKDEMMITLSALQKAQDEFRKKYKKPSRSIAILREDVISNYLNKLNKKK